MDDETWRARSAEVEAHYDRRLFAADYRERLYLPYALEIMAYVSECIDADLYEMERPAPPNPWCAREIARWDERWRNGDSPTTLVHSTGVTTA